MVAYARRCWPGPHTLVLPRSETAPRNVGGEGGTVACRVPAVPGLRALVAGAGGPLVSTSANRAGEAARVSLAAAAELFGDRIDAVLELEWDGTAGPGVASTLLDLTGWPPRILRDGPSPPPPWSGEQGGEGARS